MKQPCPSSTAGMAAQWFPGSLVEPRRRLWLALKPSRGRVGPMTQQSVWHEDLQDRSRLRWRDALIRSSDVTPKVSPTVDRSDAAWNRSVGPVHGRRDLRSDVAGPDQRVPPAKPAAVLQVFVPHGLLRHGTNPATRRLQGEPKPSSGFDK